MYRVFVFFFCFSFLNLTLYSQSCLPEGITFYSQSEVDSFPINYPDCTEIEGFLRIYGDSIINLNGLIQITDVGAEVIIGWENNDIIIDDFSGLENLNYIGTGLIIKKCSQIVNLNGLDSLESLSWINISDCPLMEDLNGLNSISSIGGNISIYGCPQLTSLNGLNAVSYIGVFRIRDCSLIEDLNGLDSISSMGTIHLTDCSELSSLNGINTITELGAISISNCNQLTTIDVFHQITELGYLELESNDSLTSIEGLSNVQAINSLYIKNNPLLLSFNELTSLTVLSGQSQTLREIVISNNTSLTTLAFPNELEQKNIINLSISENPLIENLAGLNFIDSIYGDCEIIDNIALQSFSGLDNLSHTNDFIIEGNSSLQNLHNLGSLSNVEGYLKIIENNSLINLDGLQNLEAISPLPSSGGGLFIKSNSSLVSLYGLNNVHTVAGPLFINDNINLLSLAALSDMNSTITTYYYYNMLEVIGNTSLISLNGLENFPINSLNVIRIEDNSSLAYCAVQSVCDYLDGEGYSDFAFISNNALDCNSVEEVEDDCEYGEPCYIGDLELSSQIEVDEFSVNYPNCNIVSGDLIIEGDDIENLNGLSQIAQINGSLYIGIISGNPLLTDLSGLSNVSSIEGELWIVNNNELEDLNGIHNISASSIESIEISDNDLLSNCALQNFCNFLNQEEPEAVFSFNNTGCNSIEQVEYACITEVNEIDRNSLITIYPNPTKNTLNIELNTSEEIETIQIFNQLGSLIYSGDFSNSIDLSNVSSGLYILKIEGPNIQIREIFYKD